jgi:hypothetical protein
MAETPVPGTSATESPMGEQSELEVTEQPRFTIGPPDPVTDSQQLPAVTADQEADFVSRANRGIEHPDNAEADDDDIAALLAAEASEPSDDDDDLAGDDELAELVVDVDVDDVDDIGFDDADLEEPFEIDITDYADDQAGREGI